MANKVNARKVATLAGQLIAGIPKLPASVTSITLNGSSFTPAQLSTALQVLVALQADVDAAQAALDAKKAALAAQLAAPRALVSAFVQFLRAAFGNQPDVLALFGLAPKKAATPLTTEEKAAAVAKRASTRAARGTKGPKAKAKIKGTVTGVLVTPLEPQAPSVPVAATPSQVPSKTGTATGSGTPQTG
ncbi:MAG TPA: hypothetical protein VGG39_33530 [Polyangiaceae bacterium]|jgi:hypothetical protein